MLMYGKHIFDKLNFLFDRNKKQLTAKAKIYYHDIGDWLNQRNDALLKPPNIQPLHFEKCCLTQWYTAAIWVVLHNCV